LFRGGNELLLLVDRLLQRCDVVLELRSFLALGRQQYEPEGCDQTRHDEARQDRAVS
jgi:hypothetical protein